MKKKINPATYLERLRRQHGMSQVALAEKLEVTVSKIHRFERGETVPNIVEAFDYAKTFNMTVTDFIEAVVIMIKENEAR